MERVAQAETPMMLVLGLAGGAGAATWNSEGPNDPAEAAEAADSPKVPLPAPAEQAEAASTETSAGQPSAAAPPPEREATAVAIEPPATQPTASPARIDLPTIEALPSSPLADAPPPPSADPMPPAAPLTKEADPAPSRGVVHAAAESLPDSQPLTVPEPEVVAAPPPEQPAELPAEPTDTPAGAAAPTAVAAVAAAAAAAAVDTATPRQSVETAAVTAVSDLAELAGLADSLQPLPVPTVAAESPAKSPAEPTAESSEPSAVLRKAKATITRLAQNALPDLPEGDARVVATALLQELPADGEDEEADSPHEDPADPLEESALPASEVPALTGPPTRLGQPSAPDELKPQRPDRAGTAFEVPAAAGDLLISANSQTDFQMDEKRVVFKGTVIMKNERFYLTADSLVAYMKENQSGLEFAEAQGNVIVRMVANGRETGSYGHSKTAVFHPETGEIILKGWPQLRMGNKAHVASSATTEMSLFTDGRMKTSGRNQTMIVP